MEWISLAAAQGALVPPIVDKAAETYLNNGVLGLTCVALLIALCVAGWTIRRLYNDNQALHAIIAKALSDATAAFKESTSAIVETRGTLQVVNSTVSTLGKGVDELSHENEKADQEVRHALGNIRSALDAIASVLQAIRAKVSA